MLALLGIAAILTLIGLILSNRCSPIVALVLVPAGAALIGGFGFGATKFMVAGLTSIAPVVAMFIFAILYFGVMTDAGLIDPLIRIVLRIVGRHPKRVVMGTALLALLVHLDGSGAVCFLVVIPAMLPLYQVLGLDRRVLACAASMAAGVNFLPWTGPTLRAATALHLSAISIFRPMIGVQLVGIAFVMAVCWWLGRKASATEATELPSHTLTAAEQTLRRPGRFWFNLALTLAVIGTMITGVVPPAIAFMVGLALALVINYPKPADQRVRLEAHARAALTMAGILLAAGVFSGLMSGSGMLNAIAVAATSHLPRAGGAHIPVVLAILSMPLSMLFDPDSFYFGVLPVLAAVHRNLGGEPIQVAQAALIGQMTTGFPISPLTPASFLVAGLSGVDYSAHQRFSAPWLFAASLVMTVAALAFRVFPL